jgi:hypothetical protein
MKRLSAAAVFLLGMSSLVRAQNQVPAAITDADAAAESAQIEPAVKPAPVWPRQVAPFYGMLPATSTLSNSVGAALRATPAAREMFAPQPAAEPPESAAAPAAPLPRYDPTERYQRWEIGLGFAFVRFRSSVYTASAVGLNSSLVYHLKDWVAIEGAVTSAFAPTIYQNEHVKYVGYGAGPKFTFGRDQFEPWVHVLVGGMHILPQTARGGQNGFEVVAGGGVDYNFSSRWAARLEADWVNTHVFAQSQNNGQASLGVVLHF